jgi:hypothetical protein
MRQILFICAAVLAGCAHQRPVHLPDGSIGYVTYCDGAGASIAQCMNAASKRCGGSYTVVSASEAVRNTVVNQVGTAQVVNNVPIGTLVYKCGR